MAEQLGQDIREQVRERYAAAARNAAGGERPSCGEMDSEGCGCGPATADPAHGTPVFGAGLYGDELGDPDAATALAASLGCGNPTAIAELREGDTVLDLGSGAGGDVLLSAKSVGLSGTAYGLDMTDEMLELARANARAAGLANVEFLKGEIEQIPLPNQSVDVVISNCVINLSGDKPQVLREAARVLRPGGRFAVSDVIADEDMDEATRIDMQQWTGCVAGALTRREFKQSLTAAGLEDVDITETHRVHEHAASAIIRARRPT